MAAGSLEAAEGELRLLELGAVMALEASDGGVANIDVETGEGCASGGNGGSVGRSGYRGEDHDCGGSGTLGKSRARGW